MLSLMRMHADTAIQYNTPRSRAGAADEPAPDADRPKWVPPAAHPGAGVLAMALGLQKKAPPPPPPTAVCGMRAWMGAWCAHGAGRG
jgi:hypothetical protein